MGALILLTLPENKGKIVYVISANNPFKKKVLPGDRLLLFTKLITFKRGIAEMNRLVK